MSLLLDVVEFFTARGLIAGDGIDTFRDFQPEAPDNIVSLHEYNGDPLSPYTTAVHRSVQIVVRNKDADTARTKAVQLCTAIRDTASEDGSIQFTPTRWGQVYIRQAPYKFAQDENDRTLYGFNLGITTTIE